MIELVPPSGKTLMERVEDSLLPLINLVFLLLMFFIVAGQLADTPLPDLPAAARAEGRQPPHADLMISADNGWHIDGETVSREELPTRLPMPDESTPLKIAAEEDVAMSDLEDLLRLLESNGYTEVILLTEPMQ
ncbi:MAG: biopolymer transporter ExbD [Marinobacter sp.]